MNTVNVVEILDGNVNQLFAFADDEAGNKAAEELFTRLVAENNDGTPDDMEALIDDGNYSSGEYSVQLVHSM